jgi:hypothetical protein
MGFLFHSFPVDKKRPGSCHLIFTQFSQSSDEKTLGIVRFFGAVILRDFLAALNGFFRPPSGRPAAKPDAWG